MIEKFTTFYKENQQVVKMGAAGFLVSLGSFLAGYIMGANILTRPPIIIDLPQNYMIQQNSTTAVIGASTVTDQAIPSGSIKTADSKFFASINGKSFYSISCEKGSRIKVENRTYFTLQQEAVDAGYKIATKCY